MLISKNMIKTKELPNYWTIVETPQGAYYHTCPLCYGWSNIFVGDCAECNNEEHDIFCDVCNNGNTHYYCVECNIIFDACCIKFDRGCTDVDYYALLISSYTNEEGVLTIGMPQFESLEHAMKMYSRIKPKFVCNNINCLKSK